MNFKKYQKIEIRWLDSMHESGWRYVNNIYPSKKEDMLNTSVGYLLLKTELAITICQSYRILPYKDGNISIDSIMEIPMCSVLKIKKLL